MKKQFLAFCLIFLLSTPALAAKLLNVRSSSSVEKVRVVFDFDAPVTYKTVTTGGTVLIRLDKVVPDKKPGELAVEDDVVKKILVRKDKEKTWVKIFSKKPLKADSFVLKDPDRLVVDIFKLREMKTEIPGKIEKGQATVITPVAPLATREAGAKETSKKAIISSIKTGSSFDGLKVVFVLDKMVGYAVSSSESGLVMTLPDAYLEEPTTEVKVEDKILSKVQLKREYGDLVATFPFNYRTPVRVYTLPTPYRIVIEFVRIFEEKKEEGVATGVKHIQLRRGTRHGPVVVNAVVAEGERVNISPALAKADVRRVMEFLDENDNLVTEVVDADVTRNFFKNPVSKMVKDNGALAGINGTYFSSTGRPLGALMIDGDWVSFPINARSALAIAKDGTCHIENIKVNARLVLEDGTEVGINGLNRLRGEEEVILYNSIFGNSTDTNPSGVDIVIRGGKVEKKLLSNGDIPQDGYIISAHGAAGRGLYELIEVGDEVDIKIELDPKIARVKHIIGGGPRLVKDGVVYVTDDEEKFKADVKNGRAARTAVGLTKDDKVILVTVDGLLRVKRNDGGRNILESIGMSLDELANLMIDLGAKDALNFDGGSSTTMVIKDQVVNVPVRLQESPVGDAILLK